jgi:tetratricopeptide (TPR) repeat protein
VLGNLQREGDTPGKPGITFEVTDIRGEKLPELHTIWEETPTGGSAIAPVSTAVPKTNGLAHPDGSKQAQEYYERKQAQQYYDISQQLGGAGLFKDALSYLQEALKLRKDYSAAAQALAQTTSELQDQEGNASVYATGKTLQNAGLLQQAIECYKKPIPPKDQPTAEKAWKTAFQLARGKEAAAFLTLASLYRQEGVYLFEESIALYKLAIEKGSVQAVEALESFQRHLADKLTKAGQLLHALTRYDAAETYLLMALKSVPDHPQAQAALATLKQRKPPEENKEALAFFTLGKLYENSGALDLAKTQYEEAVKKQPSYAEAQDGLRRVLMSSGRTLSGRYIALLKPATRYLALELSKRTMLDDVSRDRTEDTSRRDKARVYNFVGACYLNSASTHRPFYQLATDNFEQATQCDPKWYLPYENLGDTYSYRGKHHESMANYDEALECLERLERMGDVRNRSNHRYTKCRIRVSQAITKLALGENSQQEARKEIRQIKKERVEKGWDYDPERAARFLYNLACWYAVAAQRKVEGKEAKEKARRYLAYSLAKNHGKDLWYRAEIDEDLDEDIRKGLNRLTIELNRKLKEKPGLPKLTNEQFYDVMEEVLLKAEWPTRDNALAANRRAKRER